MNGSFADAFDAEVRGAVEDRQRAYARQLMPGPYVLKKPTLRQRIRYAWVEGTRPARRWIARRIYAFSDEDY